MLALSLLDAAAEREDAFIVQWRERVAAGGLDDDDDTPGLGFGAGVSGSGLRMGGVGSVRGVIVSGGGGNGGRGGGGGVGGRRGVGGSLAPPANLGKLLADGNTIAVVAR